MKMHILVATFILLFSLSVFSQETVTLDRDTAEKALKAIELNPVLNKQIEDLTKQVKNLQTLSPCQTSIDFYTNRMLTLPMKASDNSKEENKRIDKLRKDVRDVLLQDVKRLCGYKDSPNLIEQILKIVPLVVIALARG